MHNPFKRTKPWPTGHGAVSTRPKGTVMTHNADISNKGGPYACCEHCSKQPHDEHAPGHLRPCAGTCGGRVEIAQGLRELGTSETEPPNPPELQPCDSAACSATIARLTAERDDARLQLEEAKDEIRVLQDILDSDHAVEATYLDAFKRYPGMTPWRNPNADINAADDRRAL